METQFSEQLETYCTLHWWNMGKKTLSYKGDLKGLLEQQKIFFYIEATENTFCFRYKFENLHGISFNCKGLKSDFTHFAKQFIQMELVRMGDKSSLYVNCDWRPKVTVNF